MLRFCWSPRPGSGLTLSPPPPTFCRRLLAAPVAGPAYYGGGGGCGSCCDACNDCCQKECFLHKLLAKFKKNDCCGSCNTCDTCQTCQTCQTCEPCCQKECFLHKLLAKFKKNDCCNTRETCQTSNASCGSAATLATLAARRKNASCTSCWPSSRRMIAATRVAIVAELRYAGGYVAGGCPTCGGGAPTVIQGQGAPAVMPRVGETIPAPMGTPMSQPLPKGQTSIQIIRTRTPRSPDTTPTTIRPENKEPF